MKYYEMKRRDDRAVSESIGFILIFAIVLIGIALVTLYGYPVLLKQQTSADETNMKQTMITIQNDINLLCFGNTPYKNTALRVSSGSLTVFTPADTTKTGSFSIEYGPNDHVSFPSNDVPGITNPVYTGELRYEANEGLGVISYENGAVIGRQTLSEGSYMIAGPRWFVDTNPTTGNKTLVIFIINIDSASTLSLSGIGNLELEKTDDVYVLDLKDSNFGYTPGSKHSIGITYNPQSGTSNNEKAWYNFIMGIDDSPRTNGNQVIIDDLDRTIIKVYNVTVRSL